MKIITNQTLIDQVIPTRKLKKLEMLNWTKLYNKFLFNLAVRSNLYRVATFLLEVDNTVESVLQ